MSEAHESGAEGEEQQEEPRTLLEAKQIQKGLSKIARTHGKYFCIVL